MRVVFAVDLEAFDDSTNWSQINSLLKKWRNYGILTYPTGKELAKTLVKLKELRNLGTREQKEWRKNCETLFKEAKAGMHSNFPYQSIDHEFDWKYIKNPSNLISHQNKLQVAFMKESRAQAVGVSAGSKFLTSDLEAVLGPNVGASRKFDLAEERALNPIVINIDDKVDEVWNKHFRAYARQAKGITIVDSYAVDDPNGKSNIEGTFCLLRFLDRDAQDCEVTIYSALQEDARRAETEANEVKKLFENRKVELHVGGVRKISVQLFLMADFSKPAHDRHIRFDSYVFDIGRGLRIFEHDKIQELTKIHFSYLMPGESEAKEKELAQRGRRIVLAFDVEL